MRAAAAGFGTADCLSVVPVLLLVRFVFFSSNNGDYTLHIGVSLTSKCRPVRYLVFFQCIFLWVQVAAVPRGSSSTDAEVTFKAICAVPGSVHP